MYGQAICGFDTTPLVVIHWLARGKPSYTELQVRCFWAPNLLL